MGAIEAAKDTNSDNLDTVLTDSHAIFAPLPSPTKNENALTTE